MGISSLFDPKYFLNLFPPFCTQGTFKQPANAEYPKSTHPTVQCSQDISGVLYILTQYNIAQYAARSSVVVFHTASGFLRQKTDVAKTKGAAVSSLQINTLWQDQWYALLHLNPGGHHQEDQSGCDGHPHGQNKTTFYSVSDPNPGA